MILEVEDLEEMDSFIWVFELLVDVLSVGCLYVLYSTVRERRLYLAGFFELL